MAQLLRQSTIVQVHIGPALTTGGLAVTTALTATGTTKRVIKHLATGVTTVTGAFTHVGVGQYRVNLTAAYTNTLGLLTLAVTATAGTNKSLPMWNHYMVVPANVYDSLVSGSDRLDVNATQWAGTSTATGDIAVQNSLTDKAGFTLTTGQHDSIGTRTWAVTARTLTSAGVAWTAGTRTLTSGLTAANSVWVSTTRTLTSAGVAWTAAARTLTSGGTVADSVWVETARTLTSAGTTWTAAARTLTSAGVVWTAAARGLTSKVGYALTSAQHDSIGARTWQTQLTQVTGAPTVASGTAGVKLGFVYVAARNKRITTATGDKIHNSASVGIAKAPITAATGSFTRGKYVSVTG